MHKMVLTMGKKTVIAIYVRSEDVTSTQGYVDDQFTDVMILSDIALSEPHQIGTLAARAMERMIAVNHAVYLGDGEPISSLAAQALGSFLSEFGQGLATEVELAKHHDQDSGLNA